MRVLFDTNILIDHFGRHSAATDELLRYDNAVVSVITWMEVACKFDLEERQSFKYLLTVAGITVAHTNDAIMYRAAAIRGDSLRKPPKCSLPDCIIRATAEALGRTIITRNPLDFGGESYLVHVPYDIVEGRAARSRPPLV